MKRIITLLAAVAVFGVAATAPAQSEENVHIYLKTSHGEMVLELYPDKAPKTVENFVEYVNSGHYDGTIFHRVIPGFVLQGGGFTEEFEQKQTMAPIENEADNGLKNERGTLSMARTSDPHSATSQFFINLVDNSNLDHTAPTARGWGYAVFGKVTDGLDTMDRIAAVETGNYGPFSDVPTEPVVIEQAEVMER